MYLGLAAENPHLREGFAQTFSESLHEGSNMNNSAKPTVFGVGINDVKGACSTKSYRTWVGIIRRCYCPKFQIKNPAYANCKVDKNWHTFSNFKKWYDVNYREGFQIDKDVFGNRVYSESACVFVPQSVNLLFTDGAAARGKWPKGVSFLKVPCKYGAHISKKGKNTHIGYFDTPEEARQAYLPIRNEYLKTTLLEHVGMGNITKDYADKAFIKYKEK